jgi:hypothetical protein
LDIAKSVFQVHGIDASGAVDFRRRAPAHAPPDRGELAAFVQRRVARLDRPLTAARLHSIIGAARHKLGVQPQR